MENTKFLCVDKCECCFNGIKCGRKIETEARIAFNMHITIRKTDGQRESSVFEAGHPKPVLWDNPEGQPAEGGGGGFRVWGFTCICGRLIHVDVCQKPTQYCKVIRAMSWPSHLQMQAGHGTCQNPHS